MKFASFFVVALLLAGANAHAGCWSSGPGFFGPGGPGCGAPGFPGGWTPYPNRGPGYIGPGPRWGGNPGWGRPLPPPPPYVRPLPPPPPYVRPLPPPPPVVRPLPPPPAPIRPVTPPPAPQAPVLCRGTFVGNTENGEAITMSITGSGSSVTVRVTGSQPGEAYTAHGTCRDEGNGEAELHIAIDNGASTSARIYMESDGTVNLDSANNGGGQGFSLTRQN